MFANVVTRELHAEVARIVDRFFAAWNEADPFVRRKVLGQVAQRHWPGAPRGRIRVRVKSASPIWYEPLALSNQ